VVHHLVWHLVVVSLVVGPGIPWETWTEVPWPEVIEVVIQTVAPLTISGLALFVSLLAIAILVVIIMVIMLIVVIMLLLLVVFVMLVTVSG